MKNILYALLVVLVISSCGSDDKPGKVKVSSNEMVIDTFTNGSPQLVRKFDLIDGKKVATYETEYYEDGKILKEGPIVENSRDGKWKAYYRNGQLWSVGSYSDGVRNDTILGYYESGNLRYKGIFKKGVKHGVWMFYNEDGTFKENKVYLLPGEKFEDSIKVGG